MNHLPVTIVIAQLCSTWDYHDYVDSDDDDIIKGRTVRSSNLCMAYIRRETYGTCMCTIEMSYYQECYERRKDVVQYILKSNVNLT